MANLFIAIFSVVLLLFVASITIYFSFLRKLSSAFSGPLCLPLLGHLHLLSSQPHHSLYKLAKVYGPLMKLRLGSLPVLVASNSKVAKEFFTIHDFAFASRPPILSSQIIAYQRSDLAFAPYGDHWRSMRKVCMLELLSEKRIKSFSGVRMDELNQMISRLLDASERNEIMDMLFLTSFTFNIMTRMLMNRKYFGCADTEARKFVHLVTETIALAAKFHIGDYLPYLHGFDRSVGYMKSVHRAMDIFLQDVVDEHRRERAVNTTSPANHDFVDIMLSLHDNADNDAVSADTKIKSMLQDMLVGGTDTSNVTIQWAFVELLHHEDILLKAQAELEQVVGRDRMAVESDLPQLKFLHAIIKETFRLHPPVPLLIPHHCQEDCKVGNIEVETGTMVLINVYAIGLDETVWESPHTFNPERFTGSKIDVRGHDYELLPFGSGRRGCPGMSLGMLTVQLVLANLIHGFDWRLPSGRHPMDECTGAVTYMTVPLQVVPSRRLPLESYATFSK